jgi:hypothetical protein
VFGAGYDGGSGPVDNKLLYLSGYCWFVEDRLSTAEALADAELYVFVPKRSYNEGSTNRRITYVDDLGWLLENINLFT